MLLIKAKLKAYNQAFIYLSMTTFLGGGGKCLPEMVIIFFGRG